MFSYSKTVVFRGLPDVKPKVFTFVTDIKNFTAKVHSFTLRSETTDIKE